jgi:phosphoglycolate phosphatase
MVGLGARHLIRRGFAAQGYNVDESRVEVLFTAFMTHYLAHSADLSRPFPGVEPALERFVAAGWRIAVCTNKPIEAARPLMEALDLARYCAAICGQGSLVVDGRALVKPDPRLLHHTLAVTGAPVSRAIMLGDSSTDVATARAGAIPVVAVSFGYSEVPVESLGADRIIHHFDALWATVAELVAAAPARHYTPV